MRKVEGGRGRRGGGVGGGLIDGIDGMKIAGVYDQVWWSQNLWWVCSGGGRL